MTYEEILNKRNEAYDIWKNKQHEIDKSWKFDRPYEDYYHAIYENTEYKTYIHYLNEEIKMRPIEYHDPDDWEKDLKMPLNEFVDMCKYKAFTDYDGEGYYGTSTQISNIPVDCEEIYNGKVRKEFTHVWWYNK